MDKLSFETSNIDEIEKRARKRDLQVEKAQEIDLEKIEEIERQADEQGYMIIKKNNTNQTPFTQVISDNLNIINEHAYLTSSELGFLMSLLPFLEYQINAIIDKETNTFMTVSEIANKLKRDRAGVSRLISSLIEKGIIFEFVNARELKEFNRNVTSRTLFLNPELFYVGDRNKIDGTLATLVFENDILEKNDIKLDWKVYKKSGHTFGRLYNRKTFLSFLRK